MSVSIANAILNAGEDFVPTMQPDNKNSFLLTDDECAFVNAINMQTSMLKTVLFTVISQVEEQMEHHMQSLSALRDQFITAVAAKHAISIPEGMSGSIDIDIANKLIMVLPDIEKPK